MRFISLVVFLSLSSLTLGMAPSSAATHPITQLPDFKCLDSESTCFEKAHEAIHQSMVGLDMLNGEKPNLVGPSEYWGQCEYTEYNRKVPLIAVLMHGLYEDGRQLAPEAVWLTQHGIPVLNIVLAGHGATNALAPEITYQDYLTDAERALKLATAMGDRVLLVGHSTGGALSTYLGIKYPGAVAAEVLIEPAIRVRNYVEAAACVVHHSIPNIAAYPALMKIYGVDPASMRNSVISPSAGCEVHKLRDALLSLVPPRARGQNELDQSRAIGRELNAPLLLFNNVHDMVVDPDNNDAFFAGASTHGHAHVVHFDEDWKIPHGNIVLAHVDMILPKIEAFLNAYGLMPRVVPGQSLR